MAKWHSAVPRIQRPSWDVMINHGVTREAKVARVSSFLFGRNGIFKA
jgi:hypothetical protein